MEKEKITIDYSDNYSYKDFAFNTLVPKFFEGIEVSKLAIGSTGYVTEQIANAIEDGMNTASMLIKEAFPNRAELPESIYSHAAIFQLSTSYANPSKCTFVIMLREKEIIENGEYSNGFFKIILDGDTKLIIEDKIFILDYDIIIKAQKHLDDYIFSAQYDTTYKNSISKIVNPYIKVRRGGNGYIGLFVDARLYRRDVRYENITNNSKINAPVINLKFEDQLAGFDVFYKSPTSDKYEQIETRLIYTRPLKTKFCFYKLSDDGELTISFSPNEAYFQPEFNSTLKVVLYLTNGSKGNFDEYTGSQVTAVATGERFTNNEQLFIATKPLSSSVEGTDQLDKDALQALTVEGYSTAKAITTDNDIETYYNNYKYRYGNEIKVIKIRDDVKERLFSVFMMMKKDDYIYPTNTAYMSLTTEDFDIAEDNNRFVLKPGHCFTYDGSSKTTMRLIKDVMSYEDIPDEVAEMDFVYTNMFTIVLNKKPNVVGFYLSLINQSIPLDFAQFNDTSFVQFIINSISVKRGLDDTGEYKLRLSVMPSSDLKDECVKKINSVDNDLRIVATLKDGNSEVAYLEFIPVEINKDAQTYVFEASIKTDDYITSKNNFRCSNLKSPETGKVQEIYVPMIDCNINIFTLYKDDRTESGNRFSKIDSSLNGYQQTNMYATESETITFIRPMNMMRSTVSFSSTESVGTLGVLLSSIPYIKYDLVKSRQTFDYFVNKLTEQYKYLSEALSVLRNTSHIDLKFYNTYGKSKNFVVGDDEDVLDRVNLSIKIKIAPAATVGNVSDLMRDVKIYIKKFIEQRNEKGYNNAYISNLIRKLETDFPEIEFLRFKGVNDYPSDVQIIKNLTEDYDDLTKEQRRTYVPEFLVCNTEDVIIDLYD